MKKIVLLSCITSILCAQQDSNFGFFQNLIKQSIHGSFKAFTKDPVVGVATAGLFTSGALALKGYKQVKQELKTCNEIPSISNETQESAKALELQKAQDKVELIHTKYFDLMKKYNRSQNAIIRQNPELPDFSEEQKKALLELRNDFLGKIHLEFPKDNEQRQENLDKINSILYKTVEFSSSVKKTDNANLKKPLQSKPTYFTNPYIQASTVLGVASVTALATKWYYNK